MTPQRITKLRLRFECTQEEFAKKIGANDKMSVSRWETGGRRPSGAAERFLLFFETLSDADFNKARSILERIADQEARKRR